MEGDELRATIGEQAMQCMEAFDDEMVEALQACEEPFQRVLDCFQARGYSGLEAAVTVSSLAMFAALE